jgi:hypothetical protein
MQGTTPKCKICGKEQSRGFGTPEEDICWECSDRTKQLKKDLEYLELTPLTGSNK